MPRISRSLRRPTDNSPEAVARRQAARERAARAQVLAREQARAAREADTDWSMRREANRASPAAASFDNAVARAAALPPRVLTTDQARSRSRSEARAAPTVSLPAFFPDAGGLFGREAEEGRYGSDQAWLDEYTPNLYLPLTRTFNALTEIPDRLRGVNRADTFDQRSAEGARGVRTLAEGLWGPDEIIGSGNRVNAGEGGLMDALILGTTALPVRAIREPVGAALRSVMPDFAVNAGRRARAWWDEVPYDAAQSAPRPTYRVADDGGTLSVAREGVTPARNPLLVEGPLPDLRARMADPEQNAALRLAEEEAMTRGGQPFSVANVPQTSLRRQGGVARMFEAAAEGDDAYKNALFEQYGLQMPQVVEQSGAQNYDQLTEAAYRQLGSDVQQQFDRLPVGMQYHYGDLEYPTPSAMFNDALGRGNLNVFRGGDPHPFLSDIDPATGLTANEQFRAVHDYLGHASTGSTFRPGGEEVAYAAHAQTLSPLARMALLSETRGQNSWVNYGTANAPLIGEMNAIRTQLADAGGAEADALRARLRELGGQFQYAAQEPLLLPPEYLDINSAGGVPDWARGLIVPRSPLSTRGEHYSRVGDLTQTDPSFYGTGHVGSERQMVRREGLPDRTYFYTQGADGTPIYPEEPVSLRAPYRYEADLSGLYDVNADPEGIVALANAYNQQGTALPDMERLVGDYGYGGYISNFAPSWEPLSRRAAAVFDPVTVRRLP